MTSEIKVDTISEQTSANGVTIDGLTIKDGNIIGDVALAGTTPTFTIGDAGAEDASLIFDGNAQDFYVALDDSADDLVIGLGNTIGTTPIMSFDENKDVVIHDGGLSITTADNTDTLTLTSTDADANIGPNLRLYRNSSSPADGDQAGLIRFDARNDNSQDFTAANIFSFVDDASDGTEDGAMLMSIMLGGTARSRIWMGSATAETVFNDDSQDIDFRVESNGQTHMLFVDGGSDHVNIAGGGTDGGGVLNVFSADNTTTLSLVGTDTDANAGPILSLERSNNSAADSDDIGKIILKAQNDANQTIEYGIIRGDITDASDGTEDGVIKVETIVAGTNREMARFGDGVGVVVNEDGIDLDFRVEGDSNSHLFFVNAVNANNATGTIGMNSTNSDGNFLELNNGVGGVYCANIINSENDASATLNGIRVFFSAQNKDDNASNYFVGQNTGAVRVIIHSDGDIVNHDGAYNAISDERIKEQIADASSQWDDIKALKMRKFKFKSDIAEKGDSNALWRLGVVAQELEASGMNGLVKSEVTYKAGDQETKDYPYTEDDRKQGLIPDGKDVGDIKQAKTADVGDIKQYKEVKYSILHTKALKALQEAMTKIEDLQARVTTLEG